MIQTFEVAPLPWPVPEQNIVRSNYIGTSEDGSEPVPNDRYGVHIRDACNNTIGGTQPSHRNVISFNKKGGVVISGGFATKNKVQGNYIGTDGDGKAFAYANSNGGAGVLVTDVAYENTIGGEVTSPGEPPGNIIGGNEDAGVHIEDGESNYVQGNLIGCDKTGKEWPNWGDGVLLEHAVDNQIGEVLPPAAGKTGRNVITSNLGDGVRVEGESQSNTIRRNEIYDNGGLGINLVWDNKGEKENGVTPNDEEDKDTGPNGLLNFPVGVTSWFDFQTTDTIISGILSTTNPQDCVVDVYANSEVDDSGFGEGEKYLGSATPNPSGVFHLKLEDQVLPKGYPFVSATATDNKGKASTSEFSPVYDYADSDEDGLPDEWETKGIDFDGDGTIDLNLKNLGAKWDHKDIFVEIDHMQGNYPGFVMADRVITAFQEAPVTNLDGKPGIQLYVDDWEADEVPYSQDGVWLTSQPPYTGLALSDIKEKYFGTAADGEPGSRKWQAISARSLVFHYCVFVNVINYVKPSGEVSHPLGLGEVNGDDFLIALHDKPSTPQDKAFTLMHELGHNLGLGHGGPYTETQAGMNLNGPYTDTQADMNFKPNYLSVMNYLYAFPYFTSNALDYSRFSADTLAKLDESQLEESKGIDDNKSIPGLDFQKWPMVGVTYYDPVKTVVRAKALKRSKPGGEIDWNRNGSIDPLSYPLNMNDTPKKPPTNDLKVLESREDWNHLYYHFRACEDNYSGPSGSSTGLEWSWQDVMDVAALMDADGDGFSNLEDNARFVYNPDQTDSDGDGIGDVVELEGLSLSHTSVPGGTPVTATVSLLLPAPAQGARLDVFSSDRSAVEFATSLTIPAGATSAAFTIATFPLPDSNTPVTIYAAYGDDFLSTQLTVGPGAPEADLEVTKTAEPDPVDLGALLTYTMNVTNNGPRDAVGVRLSDVLPEDVIFVSASGTALGEQVPCTHSAGIVTCDVGGLDAGESATVIIEVMPTKQGTISNLATVTAAGFDHDPSNNTAEIITTVNPKAVIIVNTTDDGAGDAAHTTLREAINLANTAPGPDTITFDVPGPGPHTIQPTSPLPTITDPVVIDGTTEPDYAGTPVIELDGSLAGPGANGLYIVAGDSTVRGLVINRFRSAEDSLTSGNGIVLEGPGHNVIEANYLGTDVTGTTAAGNDRAGIVAVNSSNNTIGGLTDAARNLISGNQRAGILLAPASDSNLVQGNYIGITAAGDRTLGNAGAGVEIVGAQFNTIGGALWAGRNVISGNWSGVRLQDSQDNLVQGNFIGTTPAGGGGVDNEKAGVAIVGGARNTIGGAAPGAGNVISGNYGGIDVRRPAGEARPELFHRILGNKIGTSFDGETPVYNYRYSIWIPDGGAVVGGTLPGEGNIIAYSGSGYTPGVGINSWSDELVIRGNTIFNNSFIQIDLGPQGGTPNDVDDHKPPLNFPVLTDAFSDGVTTRVQGEINTPFYELPAGGGAPVAIDVTLDFYSTVFNERESRAYLGSVTLEARTGPGGAPTLATRMPFHATLPVGVPLGHFVTATTIKGHRSSEFAAPVQVRGDADEDGVPDWVEDAAPGSGDANGDGTPDRLQGNVASLPNAVDGEYVVLEASGDTLLRQVRALPNPSPGDAPSAATFPLGFFAFTHVVDPATGSGLVSLTDTRGVDMSALEVYGFGPTPGDWTDHWYEFSFDGTTGAEVLPDRIDLHVVDNDRGDHDLTANLQVTTLLGPALIGTGEGTTFVVNATYDGSDDPELLTLREAIVLANFQPGRDRVEFDIPGTGVPGSGVHWFVAKSPLVITDPIVIDGYTQPGAAPATETSEPILRIALGSGPFVPVGLHITGGNSVVRGLIIGGFRDGTGILLENLGGNVIEGNFIGVDSTGRSPGVGGAHNDKGVVIDGSPDNRIGGTTLEARNVISGNTQYGVEIRGEAATGNLVQGNFIGVDVTGTAVVELSVPAPLHWAGIRIDAGASNTTIGGTTGTTPGGPATGAANVISGGMSGIQVMSTPALGPMTTGTVIQGNYIGTDVTGTVALGNGSDGAYLYGSETTVGGTTPAARNIISGNRYGIQVAGPENVVQGNFIGTDVTGTVALGNSECGIRVLGRGDTLIGGDTPGAGNLVSANGSIGIYANTSSPTVIQGNFVGTDVTGTKALPNGTTPMTGVPPWRRAGIRVGGPALIGGTTPGAANLISGNAGDGIAIYGWENVVVEGNLIGTDITGTRPLGNGSIGVRVQYLDWGHPGNTIGGTTSNAGNTIAFNGAEGVFVEAQSRIAVLGNSIYANGAMGIDLGPGLDLIADGVTPNDPGDADTGPNGLQNFPVLTAAHGDSDTTIEGTLDSLPEKTYRLEFFSNQTVDPSGHGEGEVFLGSADVVTDASGLADFSVTLPTVVPFGHFITATATDPDGNTSEFSRPAGSTTPAHGLDFGDAPEPTYPVLLASGGAHHVIVPGFHLGAAVDADEDGQPADLAVGDDGDGTDDEDGVAFLTSLVPGEPACVEVTASATGFLNAWVDFNGDGVWADFQAGEPFRVETDTLKPQLKPSVAMNAAGNSVIVWKSSVPAWGNAVRAQRYDADGSPVGEELQVNTYTRGPGQQRTPSVAMDAAGNFVIAWGGCPALGGDFDVYARRYDASGNPLGSEFQVAQGFRADA